MNRDILFSPRIKGALTNGQTKHRKEVETQSVETQTEIVEDACAICLDSLETMKNVTFTQCGHKFCTSCLLKSLQNKNSCPICRAELEPARKEVIQPLNATVTAEIIQNEERDIDIQRRIAIIEAFGSGKKELILSLCREFAFGTAHSIAGWQGTSDETYHESWREYEYNQYDDDDDDDDDDDEEQHNDSDNDSNDDDEDDDVDNDGAATECDEMNNVADDEKPMDCGGGVRSQSHLVTTANVIIPTPSHPREDRVMRYDLNERDRDRILSDARDLLNQDIEKLLTFQPSTRDQLLKHMLIGLAYSLVYYVFFTIVTNIKL